MEESATKFSDFELSVVKKLDENSYIAQNVDRKLHDVSGRCDEFFAK